MVAKKKDTSKEPWVENYPPLYAWLRRKGNRCMWQQRIAPGNRDMVECWLVNGNPALILIHGNNHGWDIFTSANTPKVSATLADADARTVPRDYGVAAGRIMVMKLDPDGIPRAYGIASDEATARSLADAQLTKYRARKRETGDDLAFAEYSERVETCE
jgi:hypothetical protein